MHYDSLRNIIVKSVKSYFKKKMLGRLRHLSFFIDRVEPDLSNKKALVIAPHPDDESIGCGGTICLINNLGGLVDVVFLTAGEADKNLLVVQDKEIIASMRRKEANGACQILGVRSLFFLDGADKQLQKQTNHLSEQIYKLLQKERYNVVFTPWFLDQHPDHVAGFRILQGALKKINETIDVYLYEIWSPLPANCVFDISKTFFYKEKAIQCYSSQLLSRDFVSLAFHLAKYRSLLLTSRAGFGEAFYYSPKDLICSL